MAEVLNENAGNQISNVEFRLRGDSFYEQSVV